MEGRLKQRLEIMRIAGGLIHSNSNLIEENQHNLLEQREIIDTEKVKQPLNVGAQVEVGIQVKLRTAYNQFFVNGNYIFWF